jgi:YfiH family protein
MNVVECPALSKPPGVAHGFFGRRGGVSQGMFASLNCGFGSSDDAEHVGENRERAARRLGVSGDRLLTAYQIHSAEVVVVAAPWARGSQPKADAMVTRERNIALGILAADCAPVLFADADAQIIGAAHAGWKGAITGVVAATVEAMEKIGAARRRIVATVGPCISQASYEVGAEFRDRFVATDGANALFFAPGNRAGHWQFDLPTYVGRRLMDLGLKAVSVLDRCTYVNEADYFSFRRTTHRTEPDYGRNLSAIVLTS